MASIEELMNKHITVFTHDDTEYQGIMFSINEKEATIVLKSVVCTKNGIKQKPIPFLSFPGSEIKDLFVNEDAAPAAPAPAPAPAAAPAPVMPPTPPAPTHVPTPVAAPVAAPTPKPQAAPAPALAPAPAPSAPPAPTPAAAAPATAPAPAPVAAVGGVFDISHFSEKALEFDKVQAYADVMAKHASSIPVAKYVKDDFFDSLNSTSDSSRPRPGREQRTMNVDTFGDAALSYSMPHGNRRGGGAGGRSNNSYFNQGRGRGGNSNNSNNSNRQPHQGYSREHSGRPRQHNNHHNSSSNSHSSNSNPNTGKAKTDL